MGTEIGARNLGDVDRYDLLAVLHSFDTAGVTIADHHTEARRFLTHLDQEERAGRITRPTGPGSSRRSPGRPRRCSTATTTAPTSGRTPSTTCTTADSGQSLAAVWVRLVQPAVSMVASMARMSS